MKTVDKNLARLAKIRGADDVELVATVGEIIGTILQKIVPIVDDYASVRRPVTDSSFR